MEKKRHVKIETMMHGSTKDIQLILHLLASYASINCSYNNLEENTAWRGEKRWF